MIVRQFYITIHGKPADPKLGSTSTGFVIHHRMFWAGRPSQESIVKSVKDYAETSGWKSGIAVAMFELRPYFLWNAQRYAGPSEIMVPTGCPTWLATAAHAAKEDNDQDTEKAKTAIRGLISWIKGKVTSHDKH